MSRCICHFYSKCKKYQTIIRKQCIFRSLSVFFFSFAHNHFNQITYYGYKEGWEFLLGTCVLFILVQTFLVDETQMKCTTFCLRLGRVSSPGGVSQISVFTAHSDHVVRCKKTIPPAQAQFSLVLLHVEGIPCVLVSLALSKCGTTASILLDNQVLHVI